MNVLIYSHAFAPQIGGVETIVMALAKGLAGIHTVGEMNITVVTNTPQGQYADQSLPFNVVRHPGLGKLLRLIRGADVVYLQGPVLLPMILASALGKNWAVEHHGFQTICPNGQLVEQPGDIPCPGHFMAHRHTQCLKCRAEGGPLVASRHWALTFLRRWMARRAPRNVAPTDWLGAQLKLPRTETIHHGLRNPGNAGKTNPKSEPPVFFFFGAPGPH